MYDYLIVGSGLYGSICAYELNKKGFKVNMKNIKDVSSLSLEISNVLKGGVTYE